MLPGHAPIGVFDSGVGGLSVLKEIRLQMPNESVLYFGDQGHVPYGPRRVDEVRMFSEQITRFLLGLRAKLIVVACNAASAAALQYLRQIFPAISFVGMEPAVKPAAEVTHNGVVGVLATPATFQGALYASVVERFASGVKILQDTCPGLVGQIENGELDSDTTREILEKALRPMLEQGIDYRSAGLHPLPFCYPDDQADCGPGSARDRSSSGSGTPGGPAARNGRLTRKRERYRSSALLYQWRAGAVFPALADTSWRARRSPAKHLERERNPLSCWRRPVLSSG